jgi:hypothetical protein
MTIEKFKEAINSLAVATSNRFLIQINPNTEGGDGIIVNQFNQSADKHNLSLINLYCSDCTTPSKNIMTNTVIRDHAHFEVPYGISYEPVRMTFLVDRDHDLKTAFSGWVDEIYTRGGDRARGMAFKDDYAATILISVLDKQENPGITYKLYNAYPKSVSGHLLNQSDQGEPLRLLVEFVYDFFEEDKTSSLSDSVESGKIPSNIPPTNSQTSGTEQSFEPSGSIVSNTNKNIQYAIDSAPSMTSIDDVAPGTTLRSRVDESLGIVVSNETTLLDGVPNKINELGDFVNEPVNIFKSEVKTVSEVIRSRSSPFNNDRG